MGRVLRSFSVLLAWLIGGFLLIILLLVIAKLFIVPYVVACPDIPQESLELNAASTFRHAWRRHGSKDAKSSIQLGGGEWTYDPLEKWWTHDVTGHPKGYRMVIVPCTSGGYFAEE